jgi:digeranylgeranylglycerophospholipid reductase
MLGGRIAGQVAAQAVADGDYSHKNLKVYEKLCDDELGESFKKYLKAKEYLLSLSDGELDEIADVFKDSDFETINTAEMVKKLIKISPKALLKLGKLF